MQTSFLGKGVSMSSSFPGTGSPFQSNVKQSRGKQRAFPACTGLGLLLAQNNLYAKETYFAVAKSVPFWQFCLLNLLALYEIASIGWFLT